MRRGALEQPLLSHFESEPFSYSVIILPNSNHITMCPGSGRIYIRCLSPLHITPASSRHSAATLPPGCLLFMLPKCLKTDREAKRTQTSKHSHSVSSPEAYIRYRRLTWAPAHESQRNSLCLGGSSGPSLCKVVLCPRLGICWTAEGRLDGDLYRMHSFSVWFKCKRNTSNGYSGFSPHSL